MSKTNKKFAWINTILTVAILITLWLITISVFEYYSLSKKTFLIINLVLIVFSLGLLVLTVRMNNSNSNTSRLIYILVLALMLAGSVYIKYTSSVILTSVNKIVSQDDEIEYHASFVTKKDKYQSVDELDGKRIGIIDNPDFIEGNVMPKDELEKLGFKNVTERTYHSYSSLINSLIRGEVDYISLPKAFNSLFMTDESIAPSLKQIESVYDYTNTYANKSDIGGSDINVSEVPFTVLIMGNDGGRTDSLMLASVNPSSMQITLTSIARDSYVPISCYINQAYDKINHARTISRDCTIKTVEDLMDISVDFFVEVTFEGLIEIVDALGTIPIDSPATFYGNVVGDEKASVLVEEGLHDLNGDQVLAFVRERSSFVNGDFQRQLNQQHAIKSLISTIAETRDINTLKNIVAATGNNVETNLSVSQLIGLMNLAINRMESTYLSATDIVTVYGSRISGQGVMNYSPDYGFDLYYYIPYRSSIADVKKLISMNMREDGILEIPTAFNYSVQDEYVAPVFSSDIYNEEVDQSIFTGKRPPVDTPSVPEANDDVIIKELRGKSLDEAASYLASYDFTYVINEEIEETTNNPSRDGNRIVTSTTGGITMNPEHSVIRLNVIRYKYVAEEEEEEPDPNVPTDEGETTEPESEQPDN